MILHTGSVGQYFDLGQYGNMDDLVRAIEALPMVTTSGNDIAGAMRALRTQVLARGFRRYNNWIQKVALTFTDDRAPNQQALSDACEVLYTLTYISASHVTRNLCVL